MSEAADLETGVGLDAGQAHPGTSAAFVLGWQMAELYRPKRSGPFEREDDADLPGIGSLKAEARIEILVGQVQVGLTALGEPIRKAGLPAIGFDALRLSLGENEQARQPAVMALHREILGSLTAADFRLGTAYGLGRALADTCRKPTDEHSLQAELSKYRISSLLAWLDDLGSAFPAHAAHTVSVSLQRWGDWTDELGDTQPMPDGTIAALGRQGEIWRSLLSGEKAGTEMLETGNYLDAAHHLSKQMRSILRSVIRHFPLLSLAILLLVGLGITLLAIGGSSRIVAGASSLIAAFGLTWKGLGTALGRLAKRLEQPLWATALDGAIANAITLLPDNTQDHRRRRALAMQLPASHETPPTA
ncbi:MAG TPA: hypothetical protein VG294_05405 [Solirubrobacteraceae bacterium]|nr:hypothetical protein [Solirubrobacteraceae bacterium]